MNRRPPGLKLSKAISGFVQHKTAAGLAPTIIQGYERDLKKWATHIGDVDIGDVTTQDVRDYLAWLRTEYKPHRWKKSDDPLSPKTLRNIWVTLSAFFRWASIELDVPNPMKAVPAPRFEEAPVEPFTQQDIEALLKACEFCKEAKTTERRRFTMRRATAKRDRATRLLQPSSPFCTDMLASGMSEHYLNYLMGHESRGPESYSVHLDRTLDDLVVLYQPMARQLAIRYGLIECDEQR